MIKNLFFDLGQVLLLQNNIEVDVYLSRIFKTSLKSSTEFYSKYRRDLVIGNISSKELLEKYKTLTGDVRSVEKLLLHYCNSYLKDFIGVNNDLLKRVDRLKKTYGVYIFTNTIDCHDDEAKKLGIYNHFAHVFKSYTDHIFKPEKESYLYCLNKINALPAECIFIDDLSINIKGAESAGLKGILYQNNTSLMNDLLKLGVKT